MINTLISRKTIDNDNSANSFHDYKLFFIINIEILYRIIFSRVIQDKIVDNEFLCVSQIREMSRSNA